jgi:hypothetical protein
MAAPVVRVLAWRTLVWSKAWNAEGEKGKLRLLQAYAEKASRAENFNSIYEASAASPFDVFSSTRSRSVAEGSKCLKSPST